MPSSIASTVQQTPELAAASVSGLLLGVGKNQKVKIIGIDIQEAEGGFIAVATFEVSELEAESNDNERDQPQGKGVEAVVTNKDNDHQIYLEHIALNIARERDNLESVMPEETSVQAVQEPVKTLTSDSNPQNDYYYHLHHFDRQQEGQSSTTGQSGEEGDEAKEMAENLKKEFEDAHKDEDQQGQTAQDDGERKADTAYDPATATYISSQEKADLDEKRDHEAEEERRRLEQERAALVPDAPTAPV